MPDSIYKIVINNLNSENVRDVSYGIFNFISNRIVKYLKTSVNEPIKCVFITGSDANPFGFCIYAGIFGHTYQKELSIPEILVYRKSSQVDHEKES